MKKKAHPLTIIEMMIVITLIGIIAAVVGYNMQGALEKGRAQQTQLAMEKVRDILELQYSLQESATLEKIAKNPSYYLSKSGLVKNPKKLLKDGWGNSLVVSVENGALVVSSAEYENYKIRQSSGKKDNSSKSSADNGNP